MNKKEQEFLSLESLLGNLGGWCIHPSERGTQNIDDNFYNRHICASTLSCWCFVLYDLLSRVPLCSPIGEVKRFLHRVKKRNFVDVVACGAMLGDYLRTEGVERQFSSVEEFFESLNIDEPDMKNEISAFSGAFRLLAQGYFDHLDQRSFADTYNWLIFPTRMNLHSDAMKKKLINEYLAFEEELMPLPSVKEEVFEGINQIICDWFPKDRLDFFSEHFKPHHGNGAVAEQGIKTVSEKYAVLGTCLELAKIDKILHSNVRQNLGNDIMGFAIPRYRMCKTKVSRFACVPKSYKTYRGISFEPASYMFYQQGIANALCRLIRSKGTGLSKYWCIDTEEWNRSLAQKGSIDGNWATIDLSSASDSVTCAFVSRVFRGSCLFDLLQLSRSQFIEVEKSKNEKVTVQLKKFAGMGSRLCFPVEVIVFAAITKYCLQSLGHRQKVLPFKVYGDDIVIIRSAAQPLCELLTSLNFKVNKSKSFYNKYSETNLFYRESCGGEYLGGYDLCPVRIPRRFQGLLTSQMIDSSPSAISGMIELCNTVYDCYPSLRRFLIRNMKTTLPFFPRLSLDDTALRVGEFFRLTEDSIFRRPLVSDMKRKLFVRGLGPFGLKVEKMRQEYWRPWHPFRKKAVVYNVDYQTPFYVAGQLIEINKPADDDLIWEEAQRLYETLRQLESRTDKDSILPSLPTDTATQHRDHLEWSWCLVPCDYQGNR